MESLSGGEKTVAALALLFAIHRFALLSIWLSCLNEKRSGFLFNFDINHNCYLIKFICLLLLQRTVTILLLSSFSTRSSFRGTRFVFQTITHVVVTYACRLMTHLTSITSEEFRTTLGVCYFSALRAVTYRNIYLFISCTFLQFFYFCDESFQFNCRERSSRDGLQCIVISLKDSFYSKGRESYSIYLR